MFEIISYETEDKICPVGDFLNTLEPKLLAKTMKTIDLLEENGNKLRKPYSEYVEDGIFELMVIQASNIVRILYFFVVGKKAILTNGFVKKTQKTPKSEIKITKKCKTDYERRYGHEKI